MVSKPVGIRIPDDLLSLVEAYGKENFAKGDQWDKTETLLSLIRKGLGLDPVRQTVQESVLQSLQQQLDNRLTISEFEQAIAPLQNELVEFDKAFNSLGATVHDHDRLLSQPIVTKDELHNAIATLTTEIEGLKKH